MKPDWSRVTLDHVRQACAAYDSGAAVPKQPAKSTFLVLDGKTYPGKFIRGLAYRLAIRIGVLELEVLGTTWPSEHVGSTNST